MMITGARDGKPLWLRKIVASAMSHDLNLFVVPGSEVARAYGLDLAGSGLQIVDSPRHANVLLVVGNLSPALRDAATVVYAQMMRPRILLVLGTEDLPPLPVADVISELSQKGLTEGAKRVQKIFAEQAFTTNLSDYDAPSLSITIKYTCPMHPEILQDDPGSCPKCGMNLVPREMKAESDSAAMADEVNAVIDHVTHHHHHEETGSAGHSDSARQYTCPMHPEVLQDEPGSCPKCGMFLVPFEEKSESGHHHDHHEETGSTGHSDSAQQYTCPMHPEVLQDEPGSCPKCGMFLVPFEAKAESGHHQHDDSHKPSESIDHSTMDHSETTFMSMVDITKGLPRSSDDLQMEWNNVPFGPFFPGLPGGLFLDFTLDGDTVSHSKLDNEFLMDELLKELPMHAGCFFKRFIELNPLIPVSCQLLINKTLENALGVSVEDKIARDRVGALELERIVNHLSWLVLFAQQTGLSRLASKAESLQLQFLHSDFTSAMALTSRTAQLVNYLLNIPLLKSRTRGIGELSSTARLFGPLARSMGVSNDVRGKEEIYIALGYQSITQERGDAFARLEIRAEEILQSLALIKAAGTIDISPQINIDELSGKGEAQLESPRGKMNLKLTFDKGKVSSARLHTPSSYHMDLIDLITRQQEIGDALIAVGSLDLLPSEVVQ